MLPFDDDPPVREPVLNLPNVVMACAAAFVAVHLARVYLLSPHQDAAVLVWFSFIPGRFLSDGGLLSPDGWPAKLWSFVTYALLHGDGVHLMVNTLWMAAFGSALASRFGARRFLAFSAMAAIAGAALHLVFFWGEMIPVVGASAAISGHMAGVARFGFVASGPLDVAARRRGTASWGVPAHTIAETFTDRRALLFLGVWFAVNFLFGIGGGSLLGEGVSIAWQAHIGGFLAGLFLFSWFDPVAGRTPPAREDEVDEPGGPA